MRIPPVRPASFEQALSLFRRKPKTLLTLDRTLFLHCQETAVRCADPLLVSNALTLSHHTLHVECTTRGIVTPPTNERVLADVTHEMIELGPAWDDEMAKRLKSDHGNFHAVFDGWAKKKPRPAEVYHHAARMFRIFELLLQPL